MSTTKIRALQAKKAESIAAARAITDKADAEKRDLTAEESAQFDGYMAGAESINGQILRANGGII